MNIHQIMSMSCKRIRMVTIWSPSIEMVTLTMKMGCYQRQIREEGKASVSFEVTMIYH